VDDFISVFSSLTVIFIVFGLGVGSILTISIMILLLQIVAMCPYLFTYGAFMYTEIMCSRFAALLDRKSTRLNSSHVSLSYAVFRCCSRLLSFPTRRSSDLWMISSLSSLHLQ